MKKMRLVLLLTAITVSLLACPALAENTPKPIPPTSATFGPSGTGFPVGKLATVLSYRHMETGGIRHHGDELHNKTELTKDMGIFKLRYGFAPGLDVRTATPMYNFEIKKNTTGDKTDKGWIGDTAVILHKVVMNQANGDLLNVALDLGAVLPTANVDSESVDFCGNDAFGGIAGVGFTYFLGSNRFDQEFNFATFTEGAHDYTKPNRFRANTSWTYAINGNFDIGTESCMEWNGESEKEGVRQNDSRFEWYAGPKAVFKYRPWGFNAGAAVTFPVNRWYEKATPSDDYRIEVKLIKVFDLN
jgi:hypothetical protein